MPEESQPQCAMSDRFDIGGSDFIRRDHMSSSRVVNCQFAIVGAVSIAFVSALGI